MTYPGQRVQIDVKVVPRRCIADPELKLFQYTAIDEFSRLRFLGAYEEQSTFLRRFPGKAIAWFKRRGVTVECVQTDNGFEFTNRFSNSKRDIPTRFELSAARFGIRHSLFDLTLHAITARLSAATARIKSVLPFSLFLFSRRLWWAAAHQSRSNNFPMRPLHWLSPREALNAFSVQYL